MRAPASPGAFRYLVSRGGRSCFAGSYGLYTAAAGGIALYVFDGTRYVVSATARPADVWNGAWHHVAGTFDGRALRLFVDGQPVGEPMAAPPHIDYAQTTARTIFGQYTGGCDLGFRGDMDLVRLRSAALSPQAVAVSAAGPRRPWARWSAARRRSGKRDPGRLATTPADPTASWPPPRAASSASCVRPSRRTDARWFASA